MTYVLTALVCAWLVRPDNSVEKICAVYEPEEENVMSLEECWAERVNYRIQLKRQGMVAIAVCVEPRKEEQSS